MLIEGWPCHTEMAVLDGSLERHETGKERRKGGSNGSQTVWQIIATLVVMKNNKKAVR